MVRSSIVWKGFAATAAVIVGCAATLPTFASQPSQQPTYWHPWFEIGGYHNSRDEDSTGTSGTNPGETTIFAPIRGSQRTLLFGQMTAKFFDDSAKEGNLAFGYRRMTTSGFNLGAWIGGDVRRTDIDNTFWQLSGGFEALSKNIDMRLNWYGPVTKPQTGVAGFAQVQLQGNQIFMTDGEEVGLKGIDGEIGFRLPAEYLNVNPDIFELRAYGGGYHFYSDDAEDNVTGVKGRLELRVNDVIASLPGSRLTVDYEVSHDDVRDTRHDVGLRVRIPLNGGQSPARSLASLSGQQRRMLDGIERDTDIVTGRSKRENVGDALTGTDFDRVAYATTDVTTTSTAAGDNSLIIVNGEIKGEQELQGNQTLMGGGSTIFVRGRRSGLVVPFTAPGAAGSLTTPEDDDADNLVIAGSNTHVSGISIVGTDGEGTGDGVDVGSNKSNIFLTNLTITNAADDAININSDNSNIWLMNLSISGPYNDGVDIDTANRNIWLYNVNVSDAGDDGVKLFDENEIYIIGGLIENTIDGDGLQMSLGNKVTTYGLQIKNPGQHGVHIFDDNNTLRMFGGAMTDVTQSAVNTDDLNNTISLHGTVFSNIANSVVALQGDDNDLTLSSITVTDAYHLVSIDGFDNNAVSITGSVLNNFGGDVVSTNDADGTELLMSNNTFNGPIGGVMFSFATSGTTEFQTGSTGNINNTGAAPTCQTTGTAGFTGEVGFVDGTVVNAATCP